MGKFGTGRFSRLIADRYLSDRYLLGCKCSRPIWPENLQKNCQERKLYILSLKEADKGYYEPLINFMKKYKANEPDIRVIFKDKYYLSYLKNNKGLALVRAYLRKNEILQKRGVLQSVIRSKICSSEKIKILKLLMDDASFVINLADRQGLSPFQTAIHVQDKKVADFLVSKGVHKSAPRGIGYAKYYKMYLKLPIG